MAVLVLSNCHILMVICGSKTRLLLKGLAGWVQLVFGMEASFNLSRSVYYKEIHVSTKIMVGSAFMQDHSCS